MSADIGNPVEGRSIEIPLGLNEFELVLSRRTVQLTNLEKVYWPETGFTKRDLLQYYADIAPALFPHLCDRAMVMKRYPNGAGGHSYFMKRPPASQPDWIETCAVAHSSGSVTDFPLVHDLASLLWIVNSGCIDLHPWYATCDDVHRPDYLHFDLDPTPGATFEHVIETALFMRQALDELKIHSYPKTTGARGIHIYIPIARGPLQKDVSCFAEDFAKTMALRRPNLITAEYRVSKRPRARVLVDYNQNAWGRTLASVYSVRPTPLATVSTPVSWEELERGVEVESFRLDNVAARVRALGDPWKPLIVQQGRLRLDPLLHKLAS